MTGLKAARKKKCTLLSQMTIYQMQFCPQNEFSNTLAALNNVLSYTTSTTFTTTISNNNVLSDPTTTTNHIFFMAPVCVHCPLKDIAHILYTSIQGTPVVQTPLFLLWILSHFLRNLASKIYGISLRVRGRACVGVCNCVCAILLYLGHV